MPAAKFESGSFSSFGDMTSKNVPLKKGTNHRIRIFPLRKMGLTLRKNGLLCPESFFPPKLTHPPSPHISISSIFKQENFFHFQNFLRRLNEKREVATPLID